MILVFRIIGTRDADSPQRRKLLMVGNPLPLHMEEVMLKRYAAGGRWIVLAVAILGVALIATATPAQADLFNLTSCHLSDGCGTATQFGTVTLTQSGTSVNFDVVLNSGNRFVETGAG